MGKKKWWQGHVHGDGLQDGVKDGIGMHVQKDDVWTVGAKKKDCKYHDTDKKPKVYIMPSVVQKVLGMTILHPDTEFLVYLKGDPEKRVIRDVYVPGQIVTSASVHLNEDVVEEGIIGALHKHPDDNKEWFSCTDEEQLNINHDISIVIPKSGNLPWWHCTVRIKRPCECEERVEASLVFLLVTKDLLDAKEKVKAGMSYQYTGVSKLEQDKESEWI